MMTAPKTFAGRVRHLGPGVVVAGSVIGSGELVLTASLGAVVGFGLLWFLLLSCWSKSIVQSELARLCILNNETFLGVSNRMPGKLPGRNRKVSWLIWYFFFNTFVALLAAGGILGGATQALQLMQPDWSFTTIAVVLSIVTALIIGSGSYKLLEKLLLAMVSIFTAITVYCSVALQMSDSAVSLSTIIAAQSFDFPIEHVALIVAVFSFTGVNIGESIYYSYFCLDKGYAGHIGETQSEDGVERAKGWLRVMHTDVLLTLILLTLVTIPFYVLGASVLHTAGMEPDNANMIDTIGKIYTSILGPWAEDLFLVGAFLVLYSTLLTWVGGDSRLLSDNMIELGFLDNKEQSRRKSKRLIGYIWPFLFLGLLLFFEAPLTMIVIGAATYAVTSPLVVGCVLYLRRKTLPEDLRSGRVASALLYLALAVMLTIGVGTIFALL